MGGFSVDFTGCGVLAGTLETCTVGKGPGCASFVNGVVWTFRFTCTTIDAFVCNHDGHGGTFEGQMYNANKLLASLVQLGAWMREEASAEREILQHAQAQNAWFTPESISLALQAQGGALAEPHVTQWGQNRDWPEGQSGLKVGLILAGNLPMVGWHDIMCTVLSGHVAHVKPSKDDAVLPRWLVQKWASFEPYVNEAVVFHDGMIQGLDAIVATGGGNATRYFESYFGHLPHLFRGHRTSVAVLDGNETEAELKALGHDVFAHFGMGCRSVTKVWIPSSFDLDRCFGQWLDWGHLAQHGKYANNYDYHKAVWLLNQEQMVENGFVLVKEDHGLNSPIGTLFIERIQSDAQLQKALLSQVDQIQVVSMRRDHALVSSLSSAGLRTCTLGQTQFPSLGEDADGVDTLNFLLGLPHGVNPV